jgi:arylsulfatase
VRPDTISLSRFFPAPIQEHQLPRSTKPLASGKHTIIVGTTIAGPGKPADVVLQVDGAEVGRVTVKRTVPAAFTASESLDVGADLGSTVSNGYFDRRPFEFSGKIGGVKVRLK